MSISDSLSAEANFSLVVVFLVFILLVSFSYHVLILVIVSFHVILIEEILTFSVYSTVHHCVGKYCLIVFKSTHYMF